MSSTGEQLSSLSNKVNVSSSQCVPIPALEAIFLANFTRLARQLVGVLVFAARPPTSAGFTWMFSSANNDGRSERSARPWSAKVAVQPRPRPLGKQGIHTRSTCTGRGWQSIARAAAAVGWLPAWRTHAGERTRPREPADFNAACCGIHMHGSRWLTIVRQIQFSSPGKNDLGEIIRIFIRVPYRMRSLRRPAACLSLSTLLLYFLPLVCVFTCAISQLRLLI